MNTDTPRTSAVTDEEYQQALTSWATAQKETRQAHAEYIAAEDREMAAYKTLKVLRGLIAAETLETINGR